MNNEIMRVIPGFEQYKVSDKGEVLGPYGKTLKQFDKHGYKYVYLYDGKRGRKAMFIHRAVAKAFLPNPENLPQVNHKDENPSNNAVENLEWCTARYNCNYGGHLERMKEWRENNPNPFAGKKHTAETLEKMKKAKVGKPSSRRIRIKLNGVEYDSMKEAAEKNGISLSHLSAIKNRKRTNTYNLKFE